MSSMMIEEQKLIEQFRDLNLRVKFHANCIGPERSELSAQRSDLNICRRQVS